MSQCIKGIKPLLESLVPLIAKHLAGPGLVSVITIRANAREAEKTRQELMSGVDDLESSFNSGFDNLNSGFDAMEHKLDSLAADVALLLWRQDNYECWQKKQECRLDSHEHRTRQLEGDISLLRQAGKE